LPAAAEAAGVFNIVDDKPAPDKLGHLGAVADGWAVAREVNEGRRPAD